MVLNEHILIAQDPRGNKLHSHSKHGGFIYWPWRVLFIQIEIKTAKRKKIIPWFNLPSWNKQITQGEYYFAHNWDNEHYSTDRTAYIFTAWSRQRAPTRETKKKNNISHLQTSGKRALGCYDLYSLSFNVYKSCCNGTGWVAGMMGRRGSISSVGCKSLGLRGPLYVTQLCIFGQPAAHTGQPFEMSVR